MLYRPDLCADIANWDESNGNSFWLWRCDGQQNQMFEFRDDAIRYSPNGVDINKCVDMGAMTTDSEAMIWDCNGYDQQKFTYNQGTNQLASQSGLCLEVKNGATTDGTVLVLADCVATWKQLWSFDGTVPAPPPPGPGPSVGGGKPLKFQSDPSLCLDVAGGVATLAGSIQIWDCLGTDAQNWIFQDGELKTALDPDMCLDAGQDLAKAFTVMLWSCNGYPQQMWEYDESNQKTVYLSNRPDSALCLDAPGGWVGAGNQMWIWDCYGNDAQTFEFR